MVDETTDVNNAAQLALVLRYVTDTGVKEWFVTFEDVTSGRRADDIAALIVNFLEEYGCLDKLVAQCYDDPAVMSSGVNGVQAKIKERAPMALFVIFCYRLNLVLTQGVLKIKECKIFFAHLNGLAAFFSRSLKRTQLLDDICLRRLPRVAPTRWQYTSRLVNTVFEKTDALKELFNFILEHHDEYDEDFPGPLRHNHRLKQVNMRRGQYKCMRKKERKKEGARWRSTELFGNRGHRVLQAKEEKDHPDCYQLKVQKPASVMVWGRVSAHGMDNFHICDGTINAESFPQMLAKPFSSEK
ncbi:hypothetical protein L3Q82_001665 [Scortum barcoo]|uniref:Uncharacterized protein n=1 Tax=Scortum barcoo TaxID=214431 RepID=A0ACB8W4V1_9TELE|nr:hypothetical protein L3Q82_001665 [Scortum barcoo]